MSSSPKPSLFVPDPETIHKSRVPDYESLYSSSLADPETFWGNLANELHFSRAPKKILDWNGETFQGRWLVGAEGNICENALGQHGDYLGRGRGEKDRDPVALAHPEAFQDMGKTDGLVKKATVGIELLFSPVSCPDEGDLV